MVWFVVILLLVRLEICCFDLVWLFYYVVAWFGSAVLWLFVLDYWSLGGFVIDAIG